MFSEADVVSLLGIFAAGVDEETGTFALRLGWAWLLSLVPWTLLGARRVRERLNVAAPILGALLVGSLLHAAVSGGLDSVAQNAPLDRRALAIRPRGGEGEDVVRARAIRTEYGPIVYVLLEPASTAPLSSLLASARRAEVQVHLVYRDERPLADEVARQLRRIAPRATSWFELARFRSVGIQSVTSCEEALDPCVEAEHANVASVASVLARGRSLGIISIACDE